MQDPDRQIPNANRRPQKQQGRMPLRSAAVQGPDRIGMAAMPHAASTNGDLSGHRVRRPDGERPQEPLGDYVTQRSGDSARRGPGRSR